MKTPFRLMAIALTSSAALLLGACTTTGMGGGALTRQGKASEPVLFSWKSTDGGLSGTMAATLPDATYRGRFFQLTRQTERQVVTPLWGGWSEGWADWPYWSYGVAGQDNVAQFITRYSGKVVATLQTSAGQRMRCRLHLIDPVRGMAGGGEGECQLTSGGVVEARF